VSGRGARLAVLVNPTAGGGRAAATGRGLLRALLARGHGVRLIGGPDAARARAAAHGAVADGVDAVVVVGGDGTINIGAGAVAGSGVPLGVVPAGSGNDVARAAGLPRRDAAASVRALERALDTGGRPVDAALATALSASVAGAAGPTAERLDPTPLEGLGPTPPEWLGSTAGAPDPTRRGRWYLCVLSAGVDAAVSARAATLHRPRGRARYVRALAVELPAFRPYGFRVTLDDGVWDSPATLVAVANTASFGGGMRIAPDARVDDGLLDVVLGGPLSRSALVRLFPSVYTGGHVRHPAVQVVRSRTVVLERRATGATPPVAYADGEPVGPLPLRIEVHPGAVRLLV
jgi:diacylglycerol kinase (ATP)